MDVEGLVAGADGELERVGGPTSLLLLGVLRLVLRNKR